MTDPKAPLPDGAYCTCGICRMPIYKGSTVRSFGFYTAHSESGCIDALSAHIAALEAENKRLREEALVELTELRKQCAWHDISTAPRDREVLLYHGKGGCYVGKYIGMEKEQLTLPTYLRAKCWAEIPALPNLKMCEACGTELWMAECDDTLMMRNERHKCPCTGKKGGV